MGEILVLDVLDTMLLQSQGVGANAGVDCAAGCSTADPNKGARQGHQQMAQEISCL